MRHVGEGLLDKLDDALEEAVSIIRSGDAMKATVTLAFSIAVDDEGEQQATYTLKAARGAKGDWHPGSGQPRLPFDAEGQLKGPGRLLAEHLDAKGEDKAQKRMGAILEGAAERLGAEGIDAEVRSADGKSAAVAG